MPEKTGVSAAKNRRIAIDNPPEKAYNIKSCIYSPFRMGAFLLSFLPYALLFGCFFVLPRVFRTSL